jgi:hypothetical protein
MVSSPATTTKSPSLSKSQHQFRVGEKVVRVFDAYDFGFDTEVGVVLAVEDKTVFEVEHLNVKTLQTAPSITVKFPGGLVHHRARVSAYVPVRGQR